MDNPELISEKNAHDRDSFRRLVRIVNIQAAIILCLSFGLLFYMKTWVNKDRYFAEASGKQLMQIRALPLPNMGKNALSNWVSQAVTQIMTFGFNDIDEKFSVSRYNFTSAGWDSFYKAMVASKIVDSIMTAQQLITTIPMSPPVLIQEGLIKGRYSWVFEMPILITFRSGSAQKVNRKNVRVVIEPVPTGDNPNGVGISEWYLY